MIWNLLQHHAAAVKSAAELVRDETYPASTRRGAKLWLDTLLNEFEFIDNATDGGYAIKIKPPQIVLLQ